jgi:MoaA/NifB/PqqE/SkfB family radical SAM enzyme
MIASFAWRALTEIDPRLLWCFTTNCGIKGMRSMNLHEKRLRRGEVFPPFLFVSIISSCQLRCQGCWVDVASPRRMIERNELRRVIDEAKRYGNHFFGILGGEPLLHPDLMGIFADHRDCYFQLYTNGQLLTDDIARELRRLGNVTPLVSIEGSRVVSDQRRGGSAVLDKSLQAVESCRRNKLITGVATSVCQNNLDLVGDTWLRQLIGMGVHYVWYYTYRVVGPNPHPELALTPEQSLDVRRFIVQARKRFAIGIIDAYWDDQGRALCPMAMGVSHHVGPGGDIEPCPIIQFAAENIRDEQGLHKALVESAFLKDFRETAARTTRGCILLERPDLVRDVARRHSARDTTQRQTAYQELDTLEPRSSQHLPGQEIPEEHWAYRFAKRHWFFGFGAYS